MRKFVYMAHHFILVRFSRFDISLVLIGKDGGLSTLSHSVRFPCHKKVLKTFSGSGYLYSKDEVV